MDLIALYREITDLTRPLCAECNPPHHCCAPVGCGQATCWARGIYEVELQPVTDNPVSILPYLSRSGCTVEPHYRPLCSLWLCPQAEPKAPDKYWALKAEIMELEITKFKLLQEKQEEKLCQ